MKKSPFFTRSPRLKLSLPTGKVTVHRPKSEPIQPAFSIETMLIPIFLTLATIGVMFYLSKTMNSNSMYPIFMMAMSIPMVGSYLATIILFFKRKKKHEMEIEEHREEYIHQIADHRQELQRIYDLQRVFLRENDPSINECLKRIKGRKSSLWERTPNTEDFLNIRIGLGEKPFEVELEVPTQEGYDINPLIEEAQQLQADFCLMRDVPISVPLREKRVIGLVGDEAEILELTRSIILQLVTHHSPDEVKLITAYHATEQQQWNWMRWLPHIWNENRDMRYIAEDREMAQRLFEQLYTKLNIRKLEQQGKVNTSPLHTPEYVFFLPYLELLEDDALLPLLLKEGEKIGACTFLMAAQKEMLPMECEVIIEVSEGEAKIYETFSKLRDEEESLFSGAEKVMVDHLTLQEANQAARSMAPLKVKKSTAGVVPKVLTFLEMYGVQRVEELNAHNRWNRNRFPTSLPVPIGVREGGKPVTLNIHDKIEKKGHGPHGLMAGTTGSGKSEVIQSLILSLATTYHPHDVAFMLIDYKGGGMSNTFQDLPHVVATITNLEDANLISRAKVSLRAELERRQKIFKRTGNFQHIDEYFLSEFRQKEPLPHLFIIIDEFAQLKKDQPEFMDELVSIAAIGRTLGVHLLLATQKPAGVVDEKIWSNSRFRICLRVQDESDSREMIKIPNASHITNAGRAYLQVGNNEVLEYFQSAWSGAPYEPTANEDEEEAVVGEVQLDGSVVYKQKLSVQKTTSKKQIQVLINYLKEEAQKSNIERLAGPWLQPLPNRISFPHYAGMTQRKEKWGHVKTTLTASVGLVDDTPNQSQYPLLMNLSEGHLLVYGMPGSGKTSFIQTLMMSLTTAYSPKELNMYLLDFGRQMRAFSVFPHVGDVIYEEEKEKIKRMFTFLLRELKDRKELFSTVGATTFESYNQSKNNHIPAIVLLIDGYSSLKSLYPEEHEQLEVFLREGAAYGMIMVVTTNQTGDMYERYRNNFASVVTFELTDMTDYYFAVGRPHIQTSDLPAGRGFVKGSNPPLSFQSFLPYEGDSELEKSAYIRRVGNAMSDEWGDEHAKSIPTLPKEVYLENLETAADPTSLAIAIDVDDLQTQSLQLRDGENVLITGRVESGKTSLLQSMLLRMCDQFSPDAIDIFLIDLEPKASGLSGYSTFPHIKGFAMDFSQVSSLFEEVETIISERKPHNIGMAESLSEEVTSPVVVIIDDAEHFMQEMSLDFEGKDRLERLIKEGRQKNLHFIMAGSLTAMNSYTHEAWFMNFKKKFTGFLLGSTLSNDLYFFNIRLPHDETDRELPAGDGFLIKGKHTKIRTAYPYGPTLDKKQWENRILYEHNYNSNGQKV